MTRGIYERNEAHRQTNIENGRKTRFKKGCIPWNKGLKGYSSGFPRSKEWRDNMALSQKGIKNSNWKGGKSTYNQLLRKRGAFKEWRGHIFERDNYTCQECGDRSKQGHRIALHPHHIKSLAEYPELAYEVDNGTTLCFHCHQIKHKKTKLTYTGQEATKV